MKKKKKKNTHGGTREGAGRKAEEEKVRVRVPISKLEQVLKIINKND